MWVIGDLLLDRLITGTSSRLSPEAAVPVLEPNAESATGGGAANLAINLAALGADVAVAGMVGTDDGATELRSILTRRSVGIAGVLVRSTFRTILKTRIMSDRHHLLRLDEDCIADLGWSDQEELVAGLQSDMPEPEAIVVSDYNKGVVTSALVDLVRTAAPDCVVYADPKGKDWTRYRGSTLVSPNLRELMLASGVEGDDDESIEDAVSAMKPILPDSHILVTRGSAGLSLYRSGGKVQHCPTVPQRAFDVSGAGDTALAALVVARSRGATWLGAMEIANIGAGIAVGQVGTAVVDGSSIRSVQRQRDLAAGLPARTVSTDGLRRLAAEWREDGLRVVFTNGCFDLLHLGHIQLLESARKYGDVLVVALNDDTSVQRLKGPTHPIIDLSARMRIIASLRCVDVVTSFTQDTPSEVIDACRPDVLVKGADYNLDDVVGREAVESWGGTTRLVPTVAGWSTTVLRSRLLSGQVVPPNRFADHE